jgi:hypothetical protein
MSTNFPGSLDTVAQFGGNADNDATLTTVHHPTQHNNLADAVVAIQTVIGANPLHGFSDIGAALATLDPSSGGVVVKTPGTSQVILPSADVIGLAIRAFNSGQASKLQEWRNAAGSAVATMDKLGVLDVTGFTIGGASTGTGANVQAASPALTGTPTAPTAIGGTNTTQIATTQFVQTALSGISSVRTAGFPIDLRNAQQNANAGNAVPEITAFTAYEGMYWKLAKDVVGHVYGYVWVPENLAGSPAAKIQLDIMANATSGVTRLQVSWKGAGDNVTMDPATLTAETAQDITVPSTAYNRKKVTFALATQPTAGQILMVDVFHDGAHANDTLNADTLLIGARLVCDVT